MGLAAVACSASTGENDYGSGVNAQTAAVPATPAVWTSENGNVLLNGKVFHIKGANWFGFETGGANLLGLSKKSMTEMLDWLQAEQFNALRIPISVQWSHDLNHVPSSQEFTAGDADLRGKPWSAILDKLLRESAKRGIVIMLDMHTIGAGDNLTTKRWYNDKFSVCQFRQAWQNVLNRFGDRWNIFSLDLKNELHDVDWGNGEVEGEAAIDCKDGRAVNPRLEGAKPMDWRQEVEKLVPELAVERSNAQGEKFTYQGLYLVQGMHHGRVGTQAFPYDVERPFGFWFGGNLEGIRHYPVRIGGDLAKKLAYTVHVYGPSVYPQPYFEELDGYRNPKNLDAVYQSQNAFIEKMTGRAVIVGEWGGINEVLDGKDDPEKKGKDDAAILGAISTWFPEHCIADAFWWAINPESTDTGGLFTSVDYSSPIRHKLERARAMMPHPSRLAQKDDGSVVFVEPGEFNPKCGTLSDVPVSGTVNPLKARCKTVNKDGVTCADLKLSQGEQACKWDQKWQCNNECAEWVGVCAP